MKRCPKCGRSFADPNLNFCLNDGELLMLEATDQFATRTDAGSQAPFKDDPPPTVLMNDVRATNPTGWAGASSTPAQWQPPPPPAYQPQYYPPQGFVASQNQTVPIVSLVLGILGALLVCCYGGIWLGLPAAILGYMGMRNADHDPSRFGGRGMAIAGIILGMISFLGSAGIIVFWILGSIGR